MKIKVNGNIIDFDKSTIKDIIIQYKLENRKVVVEKNGIIINRDDYSNEIIYDGDNIEIIRMVGGG
ncbi:MAG: sulfur carrier protein ThiS [Spirochaetota bacterium]|nr:sulfur carrier protein ThiS [Spirochaetota bacterium]